ncbi:MAG: hypothetical protein ACRYG7_18760 [Janthinobacterium lividum]
MADTENTPWHQRNWAKGVLWFVSVLSVITASIAFIRYLNEPRTELSATYQQVPFIIPDKLQHNRVADSLETVSDKLNSYLLSKLRMRSNPSERHMLDSIQIAASTPTYLSKRPLESFAPLHKSLCVLHVVNKGDKSLTPVQVLSSSGIYYEYKDGNGQLQQGESTGKFSIGELAATESRNIFIWNDGLIDFDGITLVYPDGKIRAEKPVEVTGTTAWIVSHLPELLSLILSIIPLVWAITSTVRSNRQRAAKAAIEEEERLKSEKDAQEVSRQIGTMLGINQPQPNS